MEGTYIRCSDSHYELLLSAKFMSTVTSVLGTMALVFYTFPLLGILFIPMLLFYSLITTYYCRTSVETKRLESVIRSVLYGSYSGEPIKFVRFIRPNHMYTETLTGLSTIRAFQGQVCFFLR